MWYKISPESQPIKEDEKWFIIDPNNGYCKFCVPDGAWAFCKENFEDFKRDTVYLVSSNESDTGWISLNVGEDTFKMPYYVFARYFDAEAFVVHKHFVPRKRRVSEEFRG